MEKIKDNIEKGYFECVFVDGEKEDFGRRCTYIREYGKGSDMLSFCSQNRTSKQTAVLQIIPKNQIRKIVRQNPTLLWEEEHSIE